MNQGEPLSYCAGLTRLRAILVAFLLMGVITLSLLTQSFEKSVTAQASPSFSQKSELAKMEAEVEDDDIILYKTINRRIGAGDTYYVAAAEEQRKQDYPLRPFVTVRMPTLAWISVALGSAIMTALMWALMTGNLLAWYFRLKTESGDSKIHLRGLALVAASSLLGLHSKYLVVHEVWAGLLLATSMALYRPYRWWPSVVLAGVALMIRELALPFVLLMGAFAAIELRWREVLAWAALVALFVGALFLHAEQVALVTTASDPASPSWTAIGGWQNFMRVMRLTSALRIFPDALATIFAILALFGWMSRRSDLAQRGALLFLGYGLMFMIFGRDNNFYWGLMVAPAFLAGLAFCPAALADLYRSITRKQSQLDTAPA